MNAYESKSNDEVNKMVMSCLVGSGDLTNDPDDTSGTPYTSDGWCWGAGVKTNLFKDGKPLVTHHNGYRLDYCNDPFCAWPIIVANNIDIIQDNGQGCALATNSAIQMFQGDDVHIAQDENPLRAAMIVFLMMQDAKP